MSTVQQPPLAQQKPNPANLIIPRIWLGDIRAARDSMFVRATGITTVINCTKDAPFLMEIENKYRVPVEDNLEEEEIRNMALWSSEIVHTILRHYYAGETILIHCMAGRQRSAAVTAMVLIALYNCRFDRAMELVRTARPVAFFPMPNFIRSIQYFENIFYKEIQPAIRHSRPN